jgi:tetrapyrrole methylase family protein/MazG family protein
MEPAPLDKLFELVRRLRGENGCPWDRAQTVETILSDLVEEAYELQWARASLTRREVLEETGDVLFVLVFAVALLQETDAEFDLDHVAALAHEKIKRRHPHVFGDAVARTPSESLTHWNRIKAEEKKGAPGGKRSFGDVPGNLPPIRRAEKIQRIAAEAGFDWPDTDGILAKIREEVDEVEELLARRTGEDVTEALADEIGDLYFSVTNLSRFLDVDPHASLEHANAKFIARYRLMEDLAVRDGRRLTDLTLEEMDRYWDKAKKQS